MAWVPTDETPGPAWTVDAERTTYRSGWWWGFSSGLIVGCCSTGLLAALLYVARRALECPQC